MTLSDQEKISIIMTGKPLVYHRQVWVCKREIFSDGCVDSTDWHNSEEEALKCEMRHGENGSDNHGDPIE